MNAIRFRLPALAKATFLAACAIVVFPKPAAGGFIYGPRDLILGLRQTGGPSELVVNLGQVSNYFSLSVGASLVISNLSTNQLKTAFASLNSVSWSVSSAVRTSGDTNYPLQTIWVTAPRLNIETQTDLWLRQSQLSQGNAAAIIYAIGQGAATYGNQQPGGPENTADSVIIPAGNQNAYGTFMTLDGNLRGTFQGNAENTTPASFGLAGQPVRSDLYELKPGSGPSLNTPGTYLGYFEFRPDGTMTFTAGPSTPQVTRPNITSLVRNGNANMISFTTVNGATYSLRYTNSVGLTTPVINWPIAGATVAGDGSIKSLQDSATEADRFYAISGSQ